MNLDEAVEEGAATADKVTIFMRMAEVLRHAIADWVQVYEAQVMRQTVPSDRIRALAGAALLLQRHAVPLPALLMQVLHVIGPTGIAVAVSEIKQQDNRAADQQPPSTIGGPS